MKLSSLSVYNYKSLRKIENINFNDITTIIGENDSGKTSIIDFLEIMIGNSFPSKDDYNKFLDQDGKEKIEREIRGYVTLIPDLNEKDLLKCYLNNEGLFIIKKTFTENSVETKVKATCYKDERLNIYKKMRAPELTELLKEYGIESQNNNEKRVKALEEYLSVNKVELVEAWIDIKYSDIRGYMPRIIKYGVDDYNNPDNLIYKTLQEVFINELYDKNENGVKVLKDSNLNIIIDRISTSLKRVSQQLLPIAQKINPSIIELNVEPEIDLCNGLRKSPIIIKDKNGIQNHLSNYGYGTKKRMFMSVMEWMDKVVTDNTNVIKLYDEPDNNLHIEAQRKLFRTIRKACNNNGQAIICTHSPFIIDVSPIQSIRLLKKCSDGSTKVDYINENGDEEVKQFISNMCREVGIANSHIFFEKCFIIVEGESEMNFIPIAYSKIFKSTLAEDGITLINLQGNGSALNFLKLLIDNKKDKLLMILDKDSENINSNSVINNLKDKIGEDEAKKFFQNNIIFIGDKEFEDCFTDEYIANTLNNSIYKKNQLELWEKSDINGLRKSKKFSDELKNLINKRMNLNRGETSATFINKPILGTLLANNISEQTMPQSILLALIKARKIAEINDDEFIVLKEQNKSKLEVASTNID